MGILELDLPPIQLHASTQTDIRHPEKARFLQDVGFSQIVLARELLDSDVLAERGRESSRSSRREHLALVARRWRRRT